MLLLLTQYTRYLFHFQGSALLPSPPQNPGYHVQHYGPHNVTVTVQWENPVFDGGVPVDNYTISGANIITTTSQINETTLTLPYNARQTMEVTATNCIGTSRAAMFTYFEGEVNDMLCIIHHIHNGLVESARALYNLHI